MHERHPNSALNMMWIVLTGMSASSPQYHNSRSVTKAASTMYPSMRTIHLWCARKVIQ